MVNVVVVGCGVVGAAIAYELSHVPGLAITVVDRQQPAMGATGAALGVLMGAISQKTKGNNLRMRLAGIERYNVWVPALEALTGQTIRFNQHGILRLCFAGDKLDFWQNLAAVRRSQGWRLDLLDRAQLTDAYPQLNLDGVTAAVYSPQDRQIDPTALTQALVIAAAHKGVTFQFDTTVLGAEPYDRYPASESTLQRCQRLQTTNGTLPVDWLVVAAGLGSTPLTATLQHAVDLRPVLGQAVQVQMPVDHDPCFQPVITGEDVHIVPLGNGKYWLGATVEFSVADNPVPEAAALETVMQAAIARCPALAEAAIMHTWYGLRPRPEGRPAPIIERLPGYQNVLLATGHYRNGVLLAPATAAQIRQAIVA